MACIYIIARWQATQLLQARLIVQVYINYYGKYMTRLDNIQTELNHSHNQFILSIPHFPISNYQFISFYRRFSNITTFLKPWGSFFSGPWHWIVMKLATRGKPSTWSPREGLVELDISKNKQTINNNFRRSTTKWHAFLLSPDDTLHVYYSGVLSYTKQHPTKIWVILL